MKRKIEISNAERTVIVSALFAYGFSHVGLLIAERFEDADTADDGPEVAILSVPREI